MGKSEYIQTHIDRLTQFWVSVAAILGAFIILSLSVLDYFVYPENFGEFLRYRLIFAVLLILFCFVLNRRRINRSFQYTLIFVGTMLPSTMVELMILTTGGHASPYYAGMILTIIFVVGFVPMSALMAVFIMAVVDFIYFFPILLFDEISNLQLFITNLSFLFSTSVIALAWRYLNQKNLINAFSLEYDLDQDKQKLELYSSHLEHLVEERTKELNRSELMYRSLFEYANDGIIITDPHGTIRNVNERACEIHGFGRSALVGTNMALLEVEENLPALRERTERILKGESLLYETQHYRKDGSKVSLEVSSRAIEIEGETVIQSFHRDITEKKKLQQQLLHSQKMESVGQLAGGIAQDFNNILTSILGSAEHILMKESLDEFTSHKVRNIESASRQAAQMVSNLLSFARRGSFEPVTFNPNGVVEDTLDIIARLIPKTIRIDKALHEPIPAVEGDPSQLEQVIMNLVLNARDAIQGEGEIRVETSVVSLGPEDLEVDIDVKPGRYIRILVSDTGSGIPEEHLSHIFEPFFTTKEEGKGTGLGLAMVYGIVKEHGGYVIVRSEAGEGSTFYVYLPVAAGAEQADAAVGEEAGGAETVLAVDDEVPVLEFIKDTLGSRGYRVELADRPSQGLSLYRQSPRKYDLVITDVVMPEMNGAQLIAALREINPDVRVIAVTGFGDYLEDVSADSYLKKPFKGKALLAAVREVLDR
ncbi:MAG: hypothetical protein Kow0025_22910 [Thermodesulfovibrionales bacterium]